MRITCPHGKWSTRLALHRPKTVPRPKAPYPSLSDPTCHEIALIIRQDNVSIDVVSRNEITPARGNAAIESEDEE